jgi:ribose transport system permease protein
MNHMLGTVRERLRLGSAPGLWLLGLFLLLWNVVPAHAPGTSEWGDWIGAAIPLAIAAIAQTQVVLVGGQGLGAGSTALLVNALIAVNMGAEGGSIAFWMLAGPLLGGAIGACNGAVIGYARVSSTAVTLATGFVAAGLTLLLLADPAPVLPESFRAALTTAPVLLLALLLLVAFALDVSPLGARFRAAGRAAGGARDPMTVLLAYGLAGLGYGASGVFLSAQLGTADPLLGSPSLLEIYAAVALGGSIPHLRQGSTVGALLGALAISAVANLAVPLGFQDAFVPGIDGLLLAAAVVLAARHALRPPGVPPSRAAPLLGFPAWLALLVLVPFLLLHGTDLLVNDVWIDVVILGTLTLGQALIIRSGSFDLSLPAVITLAGLATVSLLQGSAAATLWVIPLVLGAAAAIGGVTGAVGACAGAGRIMVTLAVSGALQAIAVYLTFARPTGFASAPLADFMANRTGVPAWAVATAGPLLVGLIVWFTRTRPGIIATHAVAATLAGVAGIMLAGYGGEFRVGIVDTLALPCLLAVALAGFSIGEKEGSPLNLIAAVPVVILADVLMVGIGATYPVRMIVMGVALLLLIPLITALRSRMAARSA